MAETQTASLEDVTPLPGPPKSWAPGEPVPRDMPNADVSVASQPAPGSSGGDPAAAAHAALGRVDDVSRGLADIKRNEMSATDRVYGKLSADIDSGVAKAKSAAEAAGIEPGTMKPWNEAEESAKRQTDPIAAFGSLGSVFGILASAFTHAPMENALNASAAAINAIKAGNEKDYDKAYKAWQDNTKLALDKHKIQHEQYQDAVELLKLNMAAGEAKMRVLASKFGDEKTLFLLENGMNKEVIDLQTSREKLATDLAANRNKVALENFKMDTLIKDPRYKAPVGSPERQQLVNEFQHEWGNKTKSTPAELFSNKWWAEHPEGTSEEYSAAMGSFVRGTKATGPGGSSSLTIDRQNAASVEKQKEIWRAEGKSEEEIATKGAQMYAKLKAEASAPSGNRIDDLKGKRNQVQLATSTIDHIEEMLKKHNAITGLGGKVTRPAEIVSNIFGGNETDRKQFERWVSELQEIAPRILLDSKSRPLSSEAGKVANIIAGLQFGDTTANTARAYYEFKKVLKDIDNGLVDRMRVSPNGSGAAPEAPKPAGGDWWKSAPKVDDGKRSENDELPANARPVQYRPDEEPGLSERLARRMNGGRDAGQRKFYNETRAGLFNDETLSEGKYPMGGLGASLAERRDSQTFLAKQIESLFRSNMSDAQRQSLIELLDAYTKPVH